MVQKLRAVAASLIPSTQVAAHTICNSSPRKYDVIFWTAWAASTHVVHRYTCRQSIHIHKINVSLKAGRGLTWSVYLISLQTWVPSPELMWKSQAWQHTCNPSNLSSGRWETHPKQGRTHLRNDNPPKVVLWPPYIYAYTSITHATYWKLVTCT